jgi:hypothetical protein
LVYSGHIGEGIFGALESACLVIEEAEIVLHKSHQPDLIADFLDVDVLSGEHLAEIDHAAA